MYCVCVVLRWPGLPLVEVNELIFFFLNSRVSKNIVASSSQSCTNVILIKPVMIYFFNNNAIIMHEESWMEFRNKLEGIAYSTTLVQDRILPQDLGSTNQCRPRLQAEGLTNQAMIQPQGLATTNQNKCHVRRSRSYIVTGPKDVQP